MPKTNFEMIGFEEKTAIDWPRLERMKTWAYKLDSRFGELPFWPLVKKIYDWTKDRMADCAEDNSEANELMLKRVPYHALNYAAPFIDIRHWANLHQQGSYWIGEYDVGKCFGYKNESTIYGKLKRLVDSKMVEAADEYVENGKRRIRYRKILQLIS